MVALFLMLPGPFIGLTFAWKRIYIRFPAKVIPINSTQIAKLFCGRRLANLIITF